MQQKKKEFKRLMLFKGDFPNLRLHFNYARCPGPDSLDWMDFNVESHFDVECIKTNAYRAPGDCFDEH